MARNRIIYQSQAIAVSNAAPAAATFTAVTIEGVQSCNYGVDISREDVMQYGDLGAIDRVITDAPSVTMDFSFYVGGFASAAQEPSHLAALISGAYVGGTTTVLVGLDSTEGSDYSSSAATVSLASGSLSSLSTEASVGGIPTTSLSFEGTDLVYDTTAVAAPATDLKVTTQTGVIVNLNDTTISNPAAADDSKGITNFQTVSVGFDLGSETLRKLGDSVSPYYYAKVPSLPATANMSFEGLAVNRGIKLVVDNLKASADDGANALVGGKFSPSIQFGGSKYILQNATLDSTNFSSSLGDNVTMDAAASASVGAGTGTATAQLIIQTA